MPKRCRVLFGPSVPVTQSTSDVGAPAIVAGGGGAGCGAGWGAGCGTWAAFGCSWVAFGGTCGTPGAGGLGPGGTTPAWGCTGAAYRWPVPGLRNDEISGPNLGNGALSFVCEGLRPVGGWTTGCGAGIAGGAAGGSTLASGALQGVAFAEGAGPIAIKKPVAVIDATDSDRTRRIAVNVTPFRRAGRRIDVRSWPM